MYTYKDILFALREEYIRNEEILKRLEYFTKINDDKVKVRFNLDIDEGMELPEVHYELIRRQNLIRKALNKLVGVDTSIESGKLGISINSDYLVDTKSFEMNNKYADFIGEEIGLLFDRDFTLKGFPNTIDNSESTINIDRKLEIYPDRMVAYRRNNSSYITSIYDSVNDVVKFNNNKSKCNYNNMYDLLELEFPKDKFNEYLRGVIEGSKTFGYNAYVYDNDDNKKEKEFEPIVEEKRLVLVRK